ncbi:hypothetical protein C8R48DRAFT_780343 [Suillus tomentosus]|nr:hypothetical protein C8R48DRAFT_780343 [Suillus tomentosus]
MLAAPSRRTQKETTLDIGDAEENPMAPSQLWKLKKNAMATTKTQHSVGANNKANPEAQHPGASLRPVPHKMYSSGRFGFWKPTSTSSQSIQKAIQSSNRTLKEARGKAAESDTSDNDKDQGRIDNNDKQMDGTQRDSGNIMVFGQHEGNSGDEHENGTQDDFYPDDLNLYDPNLDNDNLDDNEDFNHQPDTQEKDFDAAPSLLVDPHLDMWCLGLLLQCNIPDAAKLEMHLQAIPMHPVPEHRDALQLAQEVIDTELWIYHEKKIKLENSYFLQYRTQMARLLCDDLFTFRTELKKVIISITKTSYGIFPKGAVARKEEMQKSVTANTTKLLKTGDYLHSPDSSDGRWKNFVSQALKDSCLEFYCSNSKKALKNTEEFQRSIPVNGLLLVAIMIKGVITGFRETSTDKVPDLSADKLDSLVDNPERGRKLEEMLEEWPMTGMGDHPLF